MWTQKCEAAFEDLKRYLGFPQLLTRPNARDTLHLYLKVLKSVVSVVIVKEENGELILIHYISKVLQEVEFKYFAMEKFTYQVAIVAKKMKPYF